MHIFEIVTVTENAPNPFHLMQSTRREIITIDMKQPEGLAQLRLTLSQNLAVLSNAKDIFCRGSMLEVGIRICAVNGQTITSYNGGDNLIKSTVKKKSSPAIGTVYKIQRNGKERRMIRKCCVQYSVFIPNSNNLHCQSDYHVHACSWI